MSDSQHILLVDDDRQVVRYLKKALEAGGYRVTAVTSGRQALAAIRKDMPDLLVLDLNMPKPDGFDLLNTERSKFPYLRIIAISGYFDGVLLEAAKILGAVTTLAKPVTGAAMVGAVRAVLGK